MNPTAPRLLFAAALALMASLSVIARDGKKAAYDVVSETRTGRTAINIVSGNQRSLGSELRYTSPDGSQALILKPLEKVPHDRELFLETSIAGGEKLPLRQVTDDKGEIMHVEWMPDFKRFLMQRGWTAYLIDSNPEKPTFTRLGGRDATAFAPTALKDGRIAYLLFKERQNKTTFDDLIITNTNADIASNKALIENEDLTALAASPDGTRLATSTHGALIIIDIATGKRKTRPYADMDSRLYAHHATSLAWCPDGESIAASLHFSGGRLKIGDGPDEPMIGDRDVFIIPVDPTHKISMFTLPEAVEKVRWTACTAP